jgi:hypothetical protein
MGDIADPAGVRRAYRKTPRQQITPNCHSVSGVGGAAKMPALTRAQPRRPHQPCNSLAGDTLPAPTQFHMDPRDVLQLWRGRLVR